MSDTHPKGQAAPLTDEIVVTASMGIATCFLASNKVFGNYWDVSEEETLEAGAYEDKYPKSEYFIIDVQSHFTNGVAIGFRGEPSRFIEQLSAHVRVRRVSLRIIG